MSFKEQRLIALKGKFSVILWKGRIIQRDKKQSNPELFPNELKDGQDIILL